MLFTAAHNPDGKASLVIDLAAAGNWEVVTCAYCLAEARLNLEKKHPAALGRLNGILETVHLVPDVTGVQCTLLLPEKDRPVFASAQRCKATHRLRGSGAISVFSDTRRAYRKIRWESPYKPSVRFPLREDA